MTFLGSRRRPNSVILREKDENGATVKKIPEMYKIPEYVDVNQGG